MQNCEVAAIKKVREDEGIKEHRLNLRELLLGFAWLLRLALPFGSHCRVMAWFARFCETTTCKPITRLSCSGYSA